MNSDKSKINYGRVLANEIWDMIPENCEEHMNDLKKSFLESAEASINHVLLEKPVTLERTVDTDFKQEIADAVGVPAEYLSDSAKMKVAEEKATTFYLDYVAPKYHKAIPTYNADELIHCLSVYASQLPKVTVPSEISQDEIYELGKSDIDYERQLAVCGKQKADNVLYFWMKGFKFRDKILSSLPEGTNKPTAFQIGYNPNGNTTHERVINQQPRNCECPECWGLSWEIQFQKPCKRCKVTEQWLIDSGFKKNGKFDQYFLEITLPYPGERKLVAELLPHDKWMVSYDVDKVAASKVMYLQEEVLDLYKGVTGNELK